MVDWRPIGEEFGIAPRYLNMQFARHPAIAPRWCDVDAYCRNPIGNIVMSGPPGNGKTCTAIAIFAYFTHLRGRGAFFYNAEALYSIWREKSRDGDLNNLQRSLAQSPLLVLDDMGQGEITDAYKRWVYSLVNTRWEFERPTVITTNLNAAQFDAAFGDALFSRIASGKVWRFEGQDMRLNGARGG